MHRSTSLQIEAGAYDNREIKIGIIIKISQLMNTLLGMWYVMRAAGSYRQRGWLHQQQ
jgi:hypothetical protein